MKKEEVEPKITLGQVLIFSLNLKNPFAVAI